MAKPNSVIYWDSVVWFAWLKDERHWGPIILDGIEECAKRTESGDVITVCGEGPFRAEVFPHRLPSQGVALLNSVTQGRKYQLLDYDPKINDLRAAIREYYAGKQKPPSLADAEHLAYAIHYGVTEFWTMDRGKKGGCDLLNLSGNVAGMNLKVVEPHAIQANLLNLPGA